MKAEIAITHIKNALAELDRKRLEPDFEAIDEIEGMEAFIELVRICVLE